MKEVKRNHMIEVRQKKNKFLLSSELTLIERVKEVAKAEKRSINFMLNELIEIGLKTKTDER